MALRSGLTSLAFALSLGLTHSASHASERTAGQDDAGACTAVVGSIRVEVGDVFDPEDPKEDRRFYRLVNSLHRKTRERVIRRLLLFQEGDPYSKRVLEESERLLREQEYLYDAVIEPVRIEECRVDVLVRTRDVWTLKGGLSFGRSGGENTTRLSAADTNLLGLGKELLIRRSRSVDRTGTLFRYRDPNLAGTRGQLELAYADNSDGSLRSVLLERPFFSFETRRAGGLGVLREDRIDRLWERGEVRDGFRHRIERYELFAGRSPGLVRGGTRRLRVGLAFERHRFARAALEPLTRELPEDRTLAYPWLGFSWTEEGFVEEENVDQQARTEDLNLGASVFARLGFSGTAFGADRNELIGAVRAAGGRGSGEGLLLEWDAAASGRMGARGVRNGLLGGGLRLFWRNGDQRRAYAAIRGDLSRRLDSERQLLLGGDSGLRGYPLRFQEGNRRLLLTVEQRFYSRRHVFRLAHVGAAVFADAGRAWWAGGPPGALDSRWLSDVGLGLRISPSRSALGSVMHLDVAFPLNRDGSIRGVQWLVKSKQRF